MKRRIQADIHHLRRMVANEDFRAVSVEASLGKDETACCATVTFTNDRDVLVLETTGHAATMLAIRLHTTRNSKGLECLRPHSANGAYWFEIEGLAKDYDKKLGAALRQLTSGKLRLGYDPLVLISDFLTSGRWHDTKFVRLKHDYFPIQAVALALAKNARADQERMFRNKPGTQAYTKCVEAVLNGSYGTARRPLEAYLLLRNSMPEDGSTIVARAWTQYKLAEDLRKWLEVQGVVPGEIGILHLMDNYRRLSEALVPFIRVLSDGVCLLSGRRPLQATTGLEARCRVIRESAYAGLLGAFDPAIRHSESHAGTEVRKDTGTVMLTDRSTGVRRVVKEYSFHQIADMTRDLVDNLFPAILVATHLHELSLLLLAMRSQSYVDLLLCVGNLEQTA